LKETFIAVTNKIKSQKKVIFSCHGFPIFRLDLDFTGIVYFDVIMFYQIKLISLPRNTYVLFYIAFVLD